MRKIATLNLNHELHGVEVIGEVTKVNEKKLKALGFKPTKANDKLFISPKTMEQDAYAAAYTEAADILNFHDNDADFPEFCNAAYAPKEEKPRAAKAKRAPRPRKDWDIEYLYKSVLFRVAKADRDQLLAILERTDDLFPAKEQ